MDKSLLSIVDRLYEGVLDENAWQLALGEITDFVSGSALLLFSLNPATRQVFRSDVVRADPEIMWQYQDVWIHEDPRVVPMLARAVGMPQTEETLLTRREFRSSAILNEFLKPADVPHFMPTWIDRRPTRYAVMSLQGSRARGAFSEEDRSRLTPLIPHVRRAVGIKDRLQQANAPYRSLLEVTDRLPFGLCVLGSDWEILEASAAARELFAYRLGLHSDQGRFGFTFSLDRRAFAARLKEQTCRAGLDDIVSVSRPGKPPLSLLVMPIAPCQESWLRPRAAWLVLIFDPAQAPPLPERAIEIALNITPAEAVLSRQLALGLSLGEAADHLKLSRHTVRAQLKSVYRKLGINTQAQLVRLILTGPAAIATHANGLHR